jgi:hypothetical protein
MTTTSLIILIAGVAILCLFAGYFFSSFFMKNSIKTLFEENQHLKDYLANVANQVKSFQTKKSSAYHGILANIQGMTKQFLKK